jgi:hypothetical protein
MQQPSAMLKRKAAHLLAVVREVAGPPPPSLAVQTAQFRIPSAAEREMDDLIEGLKSGIMPPEPKTPAWFRDLLAEESNML